MKLIVLAIRSIRYGVAVVIRFMSALNLDRLLSFAAAHASRPDTNGEKLRNFQRGVGVGCKDMFAAHPVHIAPSVRSPIRQITQSTDWKPVSTLRTFGGVGLGSKLRPAMVNRSCPHGSGLWNSLPKDKSIFTLHPRISSLKTGCQKPGQK